MNHRRHFKFFVALLFLLTILGPLLNPGQVFAAAELSIVPITWNVVGLDSNNVLVGPNVFPVGARICNNGDSPATDLQSTFTWTESTNQTYIFLRPGTNDAYTEGVTLNQGDCIDFYYEIEILRDPASYNKTREYVINFTAAGGLSGSTPQPREIFVEHLVSQNRNAVINIAINGVDIPVGGLITFEVGKSYDIRLDGHTSTGYNQLESFINISNTVFRINSVHSTYSTVSLAPPSSDMLYADSCGWDNDPLSPTYRSCIVSDGKSGGDVTVEYNVTILSGIGSTQDFTSMFYDYSGSSYHYNADFSRSARLVTVISPVTISKSFPERSTTAGSVTQVEIMLENQGTSDLTSIAFADSLPALSGSQMEVASDPGISYSSGCTSGSVLTAIAGAPSVSFSGGVKASSTCTLSFNVQVPGTPEVGTYTNQTGSVYIQDTDTGLTASANLTVAPTSSGVETCEVFTLAEWTVTGTDHPPVAATLSGITASALAGSGIITTIDPLGANSWRAAEFTSGTDLILSNAEYFQFSATTTGYTDIGFQFDARLENAQLKGPRSLALYYSTDGVNFNPYGSVISPTEAFVTYAQPFTGTANTNGQTYFRIYGYNPKNPGNADYLYVDNIEITGYACTTPDPPRLYKAFNPAIIPSDGISSLTFTLENPNTTDLTQVAFSDTLPAGLQVAATPNIDNACGGTFSASGDQLSLSGATLTPAGCTISLDVSGTTIGTYENTSGFISSHESGTNTGSTGSATATLDIVSPPGFSKNFSPNPIYAGEISTLTFTISNPNNVTLNGITLNDTLYSDGGGNALVVADPSGAVTSGCDTESNPAFALTAVPGSDSIQMINGSIAAGKICKITVRVTSDSIFNYDNAASLSTSVSGLTVEDATDTLAVTGHYPGIQVLKQVSSDPAGPWSGFLNTAASTDVYYRIQVENIGDVALSSLTVSDPDIDLSSCSWPSTLPAASPTQDPTANCVLGPVTSISSGQFTNTVSASGIYDGITYEDTSSATYAISDLVIEKSAVQNSFSSAGDSITYSYLVTNNGASSLAGPLTVSDTKVSVLCPALSTTGNGDAFLDQSESVTCTATYTVTASDVVTGSLTNAAYAQIDGVSSNTDRLTIYANQPDLVVTKSNNSGGYGTQGVAFNWTIKVDNLGPVDADFSAGQIILSDTLPASASYILNGVTAQSGITGSGTISCAINSLILTCTADGGNVSIGGSSGTFTVTLNATPTAGGSLNNTAAVDPDDVISSESNESNNTGSDGLYITSSVPALTLSKNASPTTYIAADSVISYDYMVTNSGSTIITDAITIADDKTTVVCDALPVGGLDPYESIDCSATYTITQADMDSGSVTNHATASDGTTTSNQASATVTADQSPEISLVKTATETTYVAVDDELNFKVTATNTGNVTLTNVSITDPELTAKTCNVSEPAVLAPGEKLECTGTYAILQADLDRGYFTNVASTSAETPSHTILTQEADVTINADQNPNLTIQKTATETYFSADGDVLHFTVTVENTGNVTLSAVSISDPDLAGFSCNPAQPLALAPGDILECQGSVTVDQTHVDAGFYTNYAGVTGTAPDSSVLSKSAQKTIYLLTPASIGLAKEEVSIVEVSAGSFDVTYSILIKNYSNAALTDLQVTEDLATTFPLPTQFSIESVSGADLTFNGGFDGSSDIDLLAGGNSIAAYAEKTITLVVNVIPTSSGPFYNSVEVSAEHSVFGTTTDISQTGGDPDPDHDGDPTNNNQATGTEFGADLFDPPFGIKRVDDSGQPYLEWTMIWINDTNIVDVKGVVHDPIPENSTFYPTSTDSGYPLPPGTHPSGTTTLGVSCTSSGGTTTEYCYYEGPTPANLRGQIIWEGTIGPDFGVTDPKDAKNAITISFNILLDTGINSSTNAATIDIDRNGDGDVDDSGEARAALASKVWAPGISQLPATGFKPGSKTVLPSQPAHLSYTRFQDLHIVIPNLNLDLPIIGVPQMDSGIWDLTWLEGNAGWLTGTAFPTWQGNSVITAHVYDANGYPGPFVGLADLHWGDEIIIEAWGQKYTYSVREVDQWVRPDDNSAFDHEDYPWLTLITCRGYDEQTGEYRWRVVVKAVQISVK
ncbi:MAG: class F sortase [Chloroflexi bacterium]|nr:class F sortase [Chloroflexota bacterium]